MAKNPKHKTEAILKQIQEDFKNGPHQKINSLKRKELIGVSLSIPESRKTE